MRTPVRAALAVVVIAASAQAAVVIRTVENPKDLPAPLSDIARAGDLAVFDGGFVAVIGGASRPVPNYGNYPMDARGALIALVPRDRGVRAFARMGMPSVHAAGKTLPVRVESIRPDGTGIVVVAACGAEGARLSLRTRFDFSALGTGRVGVSGEVRNDGSAAAKDLEYSLAGNALQSYGFGPFDADMFPSLRFRVYQRPDHVLAWFDAPPPAVPEAKKASDLLPGRSRTASGAAFAGTDLCEVLRRLYASAGVKTTAAELAFKKFEGPLEVVIEHPATGSVFFRVFAALPEPWSVPLPPGTYRVRANLFPGVVERTFQADAAAVPSGRMWTIEPPASAPIRVTLRDRNGRPVPGKVAFLGLAPTPSPYFRPEDPIAAGHGWERVKDSVFPEAGGTAVDLPVGSYLAVASRGPEFTREVRVIEAIAGEAQDLAMTIDRAVDSRGLVSLDPHMHTSISDGSTAIPMRLRSLVAEGVDAAVSADHNVVVDFRPDLERLGLGDDLAVIPGEEVTAQSGSIHFNLYPATIRPDRPGNGAIGVEDETPATLFAAGRAADPGAVLQVNHPRVSSLGYFARYDLDAKTAATAKAPFDPGFDVVEVMNGPMPFTSNKEAIEDWFHLLNRGYAVRITGSSDSHTNDGWEPGYSRTYVLQDGPKGRGLDVDALVRAVKTGRSFVSNGPIVRVTAKRGATFGDTVGARGGRADLQVSVSAAPWIDVSEVRLVVNGERRGALPMRGGKGDVLRFRDKVRVAVEKDAWVAIEVLGRKTLHPVLQRPSSDGTTARATLPYALTNPLFIDADGDGTWTPPLPEKIRIE